MQKIDFVREPDPTSMVTDFNAGSLDMIWQARPTDVSRRSSPTRTPTSSSRRASRARTSGRSTRRRRRSTTRSPGRRSSYAIDRETMVKAAFSGTATPSLGNSLISATSPPTTRSSSRRSSTSRRPRQLFDAGRRQARHDLHLLGARRASRRVDHDGPDPPAGPPEDRPQHLDPAERHHHLAREVLPGRRRGSRTRSSANYFSLPPNPTFADSAGSVRLVTATGTTTPSTPSLRRRGRQDDGRSGRSSTTRCRRCSAPRARARDRASDEHRRGAEPRSRASGRTRRATCTSRRRRASSQRAWRPAPARPAATARS